MIRGESLAQSLALDEQILPLTLHFPSPHSQLSPVPGVPGLPSPHGLAFPDPVREGRRTPSSGSIPSPFSHPRRRDPWTQV